MIKFGTGGWRAIIGDEFTKQNIQILCTGIAKKIIAEGVSEQGIVIGYDRRFLSKEAMKWAGQTFAANGIKAFLVNKSVPTPVIMYYVMKYQMNYGIMVTASHNPAIYNGIKVFTYGGRDADEIQTKEIEEHIKQIESIDILEINYEEGIKEKTIVEFNPLNEYLDNIISKISMNKIRNACLKIALDPMYGVSEQSLKTILLTARCEVDLIHENHDTLFGGRMPAPSEERLKYLQQFVLDKNYDIGIATDGDADRLGIIDDKGNYLHPNEILMVLYYYLEKYKGWKGAVVRNLCTTHMLDKMAQSFGENYYEVPVGFKHISSKMKEADALIGGESSGGLTVRDHINGKDGVYAACLIIEMLAVTGKKLSEILNEIQTEYGKLHFKECNYVIPEKQKEILKDAIFVKKKVPNFNIPIDHIDYMDGCKIYFEDGGWVVIRFSGTEPLLRIFAEMEDRKLLDKVIDICEKSFRISRKHD